MSGKPVRVSLDLSQGAFERLKALCEITDEGRADVLRKALQLYEFVVLRNASGGTFKFVQDGVEESVVFIDLPKKNKEQA